MKLIIDTDAGADDAVGILLALSVQEVDVVAITCVYGNTKEPNVETNVLKTLTIPGRTDVRIFKFSGNNVYEITNSDFRYQFNPELKNLILRCMTRRNKTGWEKMDSETLTSLGPYRRQY